MSSPLPNFRRFSLHMEITGACPLRCRYCYNSSFAEPDSLQTELSIDEFIRLTKEARSLGFRSFSFSGGEVFAKPGFRRLLDECTGARVTILSSAVLPLDLWLPVLQSFRGRLTFKTSLDGVSYNDRVRVGGDIRTILDNLRAVRTIPDISLTVNTMLTSVCLEELEAVYHLLATQLRPDRWNIDLPLYTGRATQIGSDDLLQLAFDEIGTVLARVVRVYVMDGQPFRLSIRDAFDSALKLSEFTRHCPPRLIARGLYEAQSHPCQFEHLICVRPSGDITRCPSHDTVLTSVRDHTCFGEAIASSLAHPFYTMTVGGFEECRDCRYSKFCGAGCRANARYITGSDARADPLACSMVSMAERFLWPELPEDARALYEAFLTPSGRRPPCSSSLPDLLEAWAR